MKKFLKWVIGIASFIFMLMCFGNIENGIEPLWSLFGAIASMFVLYIIAAMSGWLHKEFYEG